MKTKNDIVNVFAAMFGGILLAALIIIIICNPSKQQPNNAAIVNESSGIDSVKLMAKVMPSETQRVDSAIQKSEIANKETEVDYTNAPTVSTIDDKIQNIAEIVNTTSDDNFNTRLNVTISNLYDKPLANIQLYISQDGNSYIPDDLSENSSQLVNIDLSGLLPGKQKTISITSNDKGNKNFLYAINTRKIRFSDGNLLTKWY